MSHRQPTSTEFTIVTWFVFLVMLIVVIAVNHIDHVHSKQYRTAVGACIKNRAYTKELIPQCIEDYYDYRKWSH